MKLLNFAFASAVVGILGIAFAATVFFVLEQQWPILRGLTADEKNRFGSIFSRMMFCVWLTTVLLYVVLTYWWSN